MVSSKLSTVINMASRRELEVVESWEEIAEVDVLEQKLKTLIPSNESMENKVNGSSNGTSFNVVLTGDDALRSQYVPPEPTVKILKRPVVNANANICKTVQPKKTLQQREEEYAQARLRILGDAPTQERVDENVCSIQSNKETRYEMDNVIRFPKGPDGTNGFKIRR